MFVQTIKNFNARLNAMPPAQFQRVRRVLLAVAIFNTVAWTALNIYLYTH